MTTVLPPLTEWETFYVILGSSAAALTGLQFVVIALTSEARVGGAPEVAAFGTPTVVHFCAVLLISAILTTPGHSPVSLSWCLSVSGMAGLAFAVWVLVMTRRQTGYAPVFEDWLWHVGLPMVAYASVFVAGILIARRPAPALHLVGAISVFLLFIGIHNAWDAAVWVSTKRKDEQPPA